MTLSPFPRLYSYVRWSSVRQTAGTTLQRQTEAARRFAIEHNLEYVEILDAGVSAFKGKNSQQGALGDFIAAVENGAIPSDSWLYVENIDRLSRAEVIDANELFLRLLRLGLTLVTGMDGKTFTRESVNKNPTDLMLSILLFMRANEESSTKQKRVFGNVAALVERQRQGQPVNIKSAGSAPWWIDATGSQYEAVKPHPVHWIAVKKAIELLLQGWGCFRVAAYLDQHADIYPPPRGNKGKGMKRGECWAVANIKKMRSNRALMGEKIITVNGQTYRLDNYYPAVCNETEFARLQEISEANKIPQGEKKQVITMLSGLGVLRCGHCGGSMSFFSKVGRIRYVCETGKNRSSDCRVWSIQGALVEALSVRAIMYGHTVNVLSGSVQIESAAALIEEERKTLTVIDEQIGNMTQAIMLGGNLATLVATLTRLEKEKEALLLEIDRLSQQEALRGGDSDIDEKILSVIDLLTPELLTDVTHPDRLKIREVVRLILPVVMLSKQSDKALTVDFRFPDGSHLTYTGLMQGSEKVYEAVWTMPNGSPTNELHSRLSDLLKQSITKVIGNVTEMNTAMILEDRRLASIERMAAARGLPALNGKDFFGKR